MRQGLRARIAIVALAASAAALLAVLLLVGPGLRERTMAQLRDQLLAEARLMARVVAEPMAHGAPGPEIDAMVDAAARDVRARVTVIAPDGRVIADSALSGAALDALPNHNDRPEVVQARREGSGSSLRRSSTLSEELLYAAVAVRGGGVVRVALPLDVVRAQVGEVRQAVVVSLLLAFLITGVLSALFAAPLAGPLQDLMSSARRFAAGDLTARIPVRRSDELGELGALLNQAQEQLQARFAEGARDRARLEAVLAAMDDGVLAVDHDGRVVLANESLRRMAGAEDPVGRSYVEVVRHRGVSALVDQVLREGRTQTLEEVQLQPGRLHAAVAVPFPGVAGGPKGAVVSFQDVTDHRHLERVRRDFVANASHELRTPLTSIRGFVEALEDGAMKDPQTGPRFLEKIRRHADRMAALVEDLLALSRLESGESPPVVEEIVLPELVADVVSSLDAAAQRKGIALVVEDAGVDPIQSDPDRVQRILLNLVDNAIKYTQEGGRVVVRLASASGGGATVEVEDDGPGIPREHLPRLFERFYRVDRARSRELGGTGLGLAIVRHLAEGMGGRVSVTSEEGRGSTFRVVLPDAAAVLASATASRRRITTVQGEAP